MSYIWHTFFFDPIYNGLVFFIDAIPGGDVGLSIIAITVLVKFVLLPLSIKAAKMQKTMRELEPGLKDLKEKYKDDREALARETMALYREAGLNPFSGILLVLLQIPIIFALYFSVYSGGGITLPNMKADFARSMNINMRYVLPAVIGVVAYTLSASVALYFTISNLVAIAQEF